MPGSPNESDENEMHRQIDWMVAADVLILEFLYAARDRRGDPSIQTPHTISLNTGYSRQHVSQRSKVLVDHGLVEQLDEGQYRLTDFGEQVLENEIPIEDLNDDDGVDESEDENSE